MRLWWLSFADGTKPTGEQFLGVAIVEALGFIEAVRVAHLLGINPGGEVRGGPVPTEPYPETVRNRLLSKDEILALGARKWKRP